MSYRVGTKGRKWGWASAIKIIATDFGAIDEGELCPLKLATSQSTSNKSSNKSLSIPAEAAISWSRLRTPARPCALELFHS